MKNNKQFNNEPFSVLSLSGLFETFEWRPAQVDAYDPKESVQAQEALDNGILPFHDAWPIVRISTENTWHWENWIKAWKPFNQPVYDLGVNSNTRDEAINALELANKRGWKKIALITSAWHMRRSKALFEQVGFEVVPVGSDLQGTTALENNWSFYPVPHTAGFNHLSWYMHEQIGWLYYKLRGWL